MRKFYSCQAAIFENSFGVLRTFKHYYRYTYFWKYTMPPFTSFFRFKMEYEIVYSVAFAVPVLYFRIFDASNGEILWDLDQIGSNTR